MKYLILIFVFVGAMLTLTPKLHAEEFNPFPECTVSGSTSNSTVCEEAEKPQNPKGANTLYGKGSVLARATTLVALITGVASVIAIIIGGIKFVVSSGDSNSTNSARNTIIYAIIGLGLALAAQAIVIFVVNKL